MRSVRAGAAALLVAMLAVLAPAPAHADEPTPRVLTNATLRWGLTNESNNAAFASGTFNFFSAGALPDPGHGGQTITSAQWKQHDGHVAIEKWNGTTWVPATWAGLSTDVHGTPLTSPTSGTFSGHSFVFDGGAGTVDDAAGTAHIAWSGTVTVLYYSGMSFFTLTDPVLDVVAGVGTLTATVQGYASSQSDPDSWAPVAPASVTIATLPVVDLGAADSPGFTSQPAYDTSFPHDFVAYMDLLGTGAFWRDSGGSTDAFKHPLPLTISYDGASAVQTPPPPSGPATKPIKPPKVTFKPTPTPTPIPRVITVTVPAAPIVRSVTVAPAPAPQVQTALPATLRLLAAPAASAGAATGREPASPAPWWIGGACLLATALLLLVPNKR